MKSIMIEGKDFARVITAGRKFMSKSATSMAVELQDQFLIEVVENKNEHRTEAYLWASDGYRAARMSVPIHMAEGGSFLATIRNPVFTPAAGTHVSIEFGIVKKEKVASVVYHEYGASFITKQPETGPVTKQLKTLKDALESIVKSTPDAKASYNSRYLKAAAEAMVIAIGDRRIPVSIAMSTPTSPILMRSNGIDAIVLPTRTPVPGVD